MMVKNRLFRKEKLLWVILSSVVLGEGGCARKADRDLSPPRAGPLNEKTPVPGEDGKRSSVDFLKGIVQLSDGTSLDLSGLRDRPLVLVFAGEFCVTCQHEVKIWKQAMQAQGFPPQGIHFLTILNDADQDIVADWKNGLSVPWSVAFEAESNAPRETLLFNQWCPERKTPCVLVQLPKRGIVYRKVGEVSIPTLEEFTGPWKHNELKDGF